MHPPISRPESARPQSRAWIAGLTLTTLLASGCAAPEPPSPLPPPRIVRGVSHQPGGALSAQSARAGAQEAQEAVQPWIATLHLVALESLPDRGDPLVDHLRLISKSDSPRLLETRLDLLAGARRELLDEPAAALAADLASSPRAVSCGRLRAALLPETATVFELAVDRFAKSDSAREGLSLRLARSGRDLEVALVAQRAAPGEGAFLEVAEEVALLEPLAPGRGLLLLIPAHFDPGYAGYALALDCAPAGSAADDHLARQARAQRGDGLAPILSASDPQRAPSPEALAAAAAPEAPDSSWTALARAAGAPLSERLLLTGDATVLDTVRPAWRSALSTPPEVSWHMERTTARALLASEAAWGRALLLERCGALGADAAALRDTLDLAQSLAEWEALLRRENRYLLRSSITGVRARAFAWLRSRGLTPAGYDPMGPREARREALHRDGGS